MYLSYQQMTFDEFFEGWEETEGTVIRKIYRRVADFKDPVISVDDIESADIYCGEPITIADSQRVFGGIWNRHDGSNDVIIVDKWTWRAHSEPARRYLITLSETPTRVRPCES